MAQKLTKKSEDLSAWYNDVIQLAKLADHGPSKGSIIIRPYGYAIWEKIQQFLDIKIREMGAQNCYFPLFIPMSFLSKEKEHVEGFAPELAVVTHGGGEKLSEPLVVRPTSETIMYDAFSKWIQSFRDLPFKINQWSNVVRWEKRPYLFIRGSEFLWQEGHTAHATFEEAEKQAKDALKSYIETYQDLLAIYGIAGCKSEAEKFAGADTTYTYEMLVPDGKVIQSCTSHNLGQNFAKAFNVKFQNEKGQEEYVWQTSWGLSTRSMGPLIMVHGDDKGLVLPPRVAPIQAVIIPIISKNSNCAQINKLTEEIFKLLEEANLRVRIDNSEASPGWKFNQYELEGVPLRIEIGAAEVNDQVLRVVRRDKSLIYSIHLSELATNLQTFLDDMHKDMFEKSKKFTQDNIREAKTYEEFKKIMQTSRGFIESFWCEDKECEVKIKEETKASTRCLPFDAIKTDGKCVYCGKSANYRWLFAQSY